MLGVDVSGPVGPRRAREGVRVWRQSWVQVERERSARGVMEEGKGEGGKDGGPQ